MHTYTGGPCEFRDQIISADCPTVSAHTTVGGSRVGGQLGVHNSWGFNQATQTVTIWFCLHLKNMCQHSATQPEQILQAMLCRDMQHVHIGETYYYIGGECSNTIGSV